jgi:1-aminocyclopropane-1-carboxylate deaminase
MAPSRGTSSQCLAVIIAKVFLAAVFVLRWGSSVEAMLSVGRVATSLARTPITRNSGKTCSAWWKEGGRIRCSSSNWDDFMGKVDGLLAEQSIVETEQTTGGAWYSLEQNLFNKTAVLKPSPVEEMIINGRRVFIKRDDLLRLPGSGISGNKARKMFALNTIPADKFPTCVVSYGGPQSNSMLALAAVVNYKNRELMGSNSAAAAAAAGDDDDDLEEQSPQPIRFVYYTKKLPRFLRKQASGNLFRALTLGMEIVELSHKEYQNLFGGEWGGSAEPPIGLVPPIQTRSSLWVPQGGACEMAVEGANRLAEEIVSFWQKEGNNKPLTVVLPGGTCTTALLVHHALSAFKLEHDDDDDDDDNIDIQVIVVPCVGDAAYAQRQMMALSAYIGASADDIPDILAPYPETLETERNIKREYFAFGEPHQKILEVFNLVKDEYGLVLDLVYGAPAWTILMRHFDVTLSADLTFDPRNPIAGRDIMYIHSGGLEGINTQLLRYKYKGLVDLKDIQLP